jgi:hypothetical protein
MEPKKFLIAELIPIIEGLKRRQLIDLEENNQLDDQGFHLKITIASGGYKYLKGYLDHYIFPKLFASHVQFDTYAFGEVTNRQGMMHLEILLKFET